MGWKWKDILAVPSYIGTREILEEGGKIQGGGGGKTFWMFFFLVPSLLLHLWPCVLTLLFPQEGLSTIVHVVVFIAFRFF